MTEIAPSASYQRVGSSRPVLETTVGGVLREAAERAAGTMALVEGAPDPGLPLHKECFFRALFCYTSPRRLTRLLQPTRRVGGSVG
jgi:hypothetical protein